MSARLLPERAGGKGGLPVVQLCVRPSCQLVPGSCSLRGLSLAKSERGEAPGPPVFSWLFPLADSLSVPCCTKPSFHERGVSMHPDWCLLSRHCYFLKLVFIYFWLCWVFVAALGLSLVVASGVRSSLWDLGFSSW